MSGEAMVRDVSIGKFREFIGLAPQWEGLPARDAATRLAYLAEYFSMRGGYRKAALLALAWKAAFERNAEFSGHSFRSFTEMVERAARRISKAGTTVRPTGESVYDQFEVSARGNARKMEWRPTERAPEPSGPTVRPLAPKPARRPLPERPPAAEPREFDFAAMQNALEKIEGQSQKTKSIIGSEE